MFTGWASAESRAFFDSYGKLSPAMCATGSASLSGSLLTDIRQHACTPFQINLGFPGNIDFIC